MVRRCVARRRDRRGSSLEGRAVWGEEPLQMLTTTQQGSRDLSTL